MNTNEKGNVGLIESIRHLSNIGFECFTPFHDYSAVDLITLNKDHKPYKLQVKYRTLYRNIIEVQFKSMVNGKSIRINFDIIDGWAVYCPEIEQVIFVNKNEIDCNMRSFAFRFTEGAGTVNIEKIKRPLYTDFMCIENW